MKIEVKNLVKKFGKFTAVDDVSFSVETGQIIGFIGPNGAGKTTTMNIMATTSEPNSGDVVINGVSALQEPEEVRRIVGFMPDSLPAHRDIMVWEYLDFFGRIYGIDAERRAKVIRNIVEFTGLNKLQQNALATLSKGQKQRVSLARALVHDPTFLIMDEPAAGLDPRARIELRELMQALVQQGKGILISSHILSELQGVCTGTVIIDQGKILESGTVREVLKKQARKEEHLSISLRALVEPEAVKRVLLEIPNVEEINIGEHDELKIMVKGDDTVSSKVLKELINREVPIIEFKHSEKNLEDIFMNVTRG